MRVTDLIRDLNRLNPLAEVQTIELHENTSYDYDGVLSYTTRTMCRTDIQIAKDGSILIGKVPNE